MQRNDYLDKILGIICNVFDAYSAVLFLPGTKKDEYRLAAFFSLGDNILTETVIKPGKGLVGWIIRNSQPLLVNNFDRQSDCLGYYTQEGESKIKAFMGCPMDKTKGALCLDSKRTYSFSDKDQKILFQFAQLIEAIQSTMFMADNAAREQRYYECLWTLHALRAKHLRWSEFLHNFLRILSEGTGFTYCFLAARDEMGETYFLEGWNQGLENEAGKMNIPMGKGLIGWVFKNNAPVYAPEKGTGSTDIPLFGKSVSSKNLKSAVCLPLVVNKKTRGVLVLADEGAKEFGQGLKTFLSLVSDYLANFLENLYMKNKLRMFSRQKPYKPQSEDE